MLAALDSIGGSWPTWRAEQLLEEHAATPEPLADAAERPDVVETAIGLAEATAGDGRQRAIDHPSADLEDLQQLRLAIRQAICAAPAGLPHSPRAPLAGERGDQHWSCPYPHRPRYRL